MEKITIVSLVCLVTVAAQTDYCQLACNGQTHTVCLRQNVNCGPGPDCGSSFKAISLTSSDIQLILDVHNSLRNKVATGKETTNSQPSASNMRALTYNNELGTIAQCLANSCVFAHDKCRRTVNYESVGQNIGTKSFSGSGGDYRSVINSTIYAWYEEVKDFQASWVSSFGNYGATVGHYTQVVWAETKEIGCGLSSYVKNGWNNFLFACNYGPGGNMAGKPIYITGSPASQCSGTSPNSRYPGLCGP